MADSDYKRGRRDERQTIIKFVQIYASPTMKNLARRLQMQEHIKVTDHWKKIPEATKIEGKH